MNKNKRHVLKGLAVGSVWATPVVSSVVLPVHASTSETPALCTGLRITVSLDGTEGTGTIYMHLRTADCVFVTTVRAQQGSLPISNTECLSDLSPGTYDAWTYFEAESNQPVNATTTFQCGNTSLTVAPFEYTMVEIFSDGTCAFTHLGAGNPCAP